MKFISTRGSSPAVSVSQAMVQGLAPDGGLYVPESWPIIQWSEISTHATYSEFAEMILKPFFKGDPLAAELSDIITKAFDFPVPLVPLNKTTDVLELFHGPTSAFKDFGARFLAECFSRMGAKKRTILVATSGDTGGAVASAFFRKPDIQVGVLFPKGKVSPRQEKQLTCWGENIFSFSVRGTFDDCQAIVKEAFTNDKWRAQKGLTSANSINIGRLLPQMVYYGASSIWSQRKTGREPGFVIPSGNLGNAVAAFYAKKLGLPLGEIVLATNANPVVSQYLASGKWSPHPSIETLASAMDVGNPSNIERLINLYPQWEKLKTICRAFLVSDEEINTTIKNGPIEEHQFWCPHTACAVHVRKALGPGHWIIVSTAHPAKFDSIVEPLVGRKIPVPPQLTRLLDLPNYSREINAKLSEVEF